VGRGERKQRVVKIYRKRNEWKYLKERRQELNEGKGHE
jgi:hypothetical protein